MPRKPRKGYFVRGTFVAAGSELDLELKRELQGGEAGPSKSELKRESAELQTLGEQLLTLRADLMAPLDLPEKLVDAISQARTITDFEGRRRQLQFVGKLMRRLDQPLLDAIRAALEAQRAPSAAETLGLHQAEAWRDRLIADDEALRDWITAHPEADAQARKDAKPQKPGEAPRHGRSYRELFQLVKAASGEAAAPREFEHE